MEDQVMNFHDLKLVERIDIYVKLCFYFRFSNICKIYPKILIRMKTLLSILFLFMLIVQSLSGQVNNVGIGTTTPDSTSILDIVATDRGLLPPRLTTIQRDSISNPAKGLMIFNTTTDCLNYFNGTQWIEVCERSAGSGGSGDCCGIHDKTPVALSIEATNMNRANCWRYCDTLTEGGFSDWILPSYNQLRYVTSGQISIQITGNYNNIHMQEELGVTQQFPVSSNPFFTSSVITAGKYDLRNTKISNEPAANVCRCIR